MSYTGYFIDCLRALDAKMSSQNTKILLPVDQCAAHPQDPNYLKNVKIMFYPPNCTSILLPFEQGNNHKFKHYHKHIYFCDWAQVTS